MRDAAQYHIKALTFATGREAFDYCDGPHEGCGGDGVAIQWNEGGVARYLVIARADARRLIDGGDWLVYLREFALKTGDGVVVCGWATDNEASAGGGRGRRVGPRPSRRRQPRRSDAVIQPH